MTSNLKVNNILPSTGTTVAVSGIASVTSSVSIASSCTATTFYGSGANLTSLPAQASITGNADNRVITGGSGVNLNGESNLTFDGTTLSATGQLNLAGGIVLQPGGTAWSTTLTRPQIQRQADGELRLGAGSDSSSIVTFYTSPSAGGTLAERLRIDSSGRIKINTTSALATNEQVTIKGGGDCIVSLRSDSHADGNDQKINFMVGDNTWQSGNTTSQLSSEIVQTSSGTLKANLVISANRGDALTNRYIIYGDSSVDHEFKTKTAASLLKLHNSGLVEIADGDLRVANGHGIDFSDTADGASGSYLNSEVLADYERGRFEPRFLENGTTDSNYSWRYGQYVRIGNICHVDMAFGISSLSGNFTTAFIGGLPFTMSSQWGTNNFSYVQLIGYSYASGYGDSGNTTQLSMELNQTHGTMHRVVQGQNKNNVNQSSIGGSQRFAFQFSYPVA